MAVQTVREKRSFKMHKELLVSVIKRQAGSLWKATIEGVMNAVDAGANRCELSLTQGMLIIKDNGKGFRSKEEIEQFFETFGQPHEEREAKVFGQFRMGRGQLFAYGRNTWRTGTFEMTVDIEADGLDYHLTTDLPHQDGCSITVELYKQLTFTEYSEMTQQIENNVLYVNFPCLLNQKQINKEPTKQKWDTETVEASIRYRQYGDLNVYNQGIKICSMPRYRYGVGGDVVTKKAVMVNFARNDIMSDCPVWKNIAKTLQEHANAVATATRAETARTQAEAERQALAEQNTVGRGRGAKRLSDADRLRLINQMRDHALTTWQMQTAKVIQQEGRKVNVSFTQIKKLAKCKVTMPPSSIYHHEYERESRTIMNMKLAFVMDRKNLQRWNVLDGMSLVAEINRVQGPHSETRLTWVSWEDVTKSVSREHIILEEKQLNRVELVALYAMRAAKDRFRYGASDLPNTDRQIYIGMGPLDSWTDGSTFVAINRRIVQSWKLGPIAYGKYGALIMHELCHREPSTDTAHSHDPSFFRRYFSYTQGCALPYFIYDCCANSVKAATQAGKHVTERETRVMDVLGNTQQRAHLEGDAPVEPEYA